MYHIEMISSIPDNILKNYLNVWLCFTNGHEVGQLATYLCVNNMSLFAIDNH